jgi:hypothetical protein
MSQSFYAELRCKLTAARPHYAGTFGSLPDNKVFVEIYAIRLTSSLDLLSIKPHARQPGAFCFSVASSSVLPLTGQGNQLCRVAYLKEAKTRDAILCRRF